MISGPVPKLLVAEGPTARDLAWESPILGASPRVGRLRELIARVAESDASVLIAGESGCGKELVARDIHARSRRAGQPFVAVNCAALPVTLLESELFGHVRGAFTDAVRDHDGLFAQAAGGTVFLDEIGEMPLEMQAKLLRVVEERAVRPIGSDAQVPVRARLITATNRDLEAEACARRFRSDLYYRINVIEIQVPPLRERGDDILLLAHHFLERYVRETGREVSGISRDAARCLLEYPWPGNVRELENSIQRAITLTLTPEIAREDLPARIRSAQVAVAEDPAGPEGLPSLREMELRYIHRVLALAQGNKSRAARVLGINRRTFYRLGERTAEACPGDADDAGDADEA